jgi:hypothetical protein
LRAKETVLAGPDFMKDDVLFSNANAVQGNFEVHTVFFWKYN